MRREGNYHYYLTDIFADFSEGIDDVDNENA